LRGKKDGYVFFGCKKHANKNLAGNGMPREIVNDFIIPSKDKETEKRHRGRHMQIEYSLEQGGKYLIKDLGIGFGAFVKLDRPLELKDNHLLNIGESFIIVNLI
jgi:hypothetical protein